MLKGLSYTYVDLLFLTKSFYIAIPFNKKKIVIFTQPPRNTIVLCSVKEGFNGPDTEVMNLSKKFEFTVCRLN